MTRRWCTLQVNRFAFCIVLLVTCFITMPLWGADRELPPQEGIKRYANLVRRYPHNSSYHNALGYYHYKTGNFGEAESHYLKAIELDGSYAIAHNNLGVLYLHQKDLEQAETHFREAVKLNPGYVKAQYNLAIALYRQRRYTEAAKAYLKAREQDSDYVNGRDDPEKMKQALVEATKDSKTKRKLKRMMDSFAPSY